MPIEYRAKGTEVNEERPREHAEKSAGTTIVANFYSGHEAALRTVREVTPIGLLTRESRSKHDASIEEESDPTSDLHETIDFGTVGVASSERDQIKNVRFSRQVVGGGKCPPPLTNPV